MGKASDVFRSPQGGFPMGRVVFLTVLLSLVVIAIIAARAGLLTSTPAPAPWQATAPPTPKRSSTGPVAARVRADNGTVALEMREAPAQPLVSPAAKGADDNDVFATVKDGEHVSFGERDAYYKLVTMAWDLRDRPSTAPPPTPVSQSALMESPASYRAKVVRLRGSLIRVRPQTLDPDPARPDRPRLFYECALKLVDEGVSIVVVAQNPLDDGIRPGQGVVYADAYFFKIMAYEGETGQTLQAPLLMGYALAKEKSESGLAPAGFLILGGLLALVVILWLVLRRGGRSAEEMRERLRRQPIDDIDIPEPQALPRDKYREDKPR